MAAPTEQLDRENIQVGYGLPPFAQAVFLSTDENGAPGELNQYVLREIGFPPDAIPSAGALKPGYAIVERGDQLLCFIATVGRGRSPATLVEAGLKAALLDARLAKVSSLWIPLMGTGGGRLTARRSETIIRRVLATTGWSGRPDVRIVISRSRSPQGRPQEKTASGFSREAGDEARRPWPPLPMEPAVDAILRLAAGLPRALVKGLAPAIVLALSLAEQPDAPTPLREDQDARDFAAALRNRSPDHVAWLRAFRFPHPDQTPPDLDASGELDQLLVAAAEHTLSRGAELVAAHDLIGALLADSDAASFITAQLGIAIADLQSDLNAARVGRISLTLHNDVASATDRLGYGSYAKAIAEFVTHAHTPPPISVSIQAPWGVGKSSLMTMVREQLDPERERRRPEPKTRKEQQERRKKEEFRVRHVMAFLDQKLDMKPPPQLRPDRRWTIWFNVWKYETTEQVWAGLVDAIVSQVSERLDPIDRELFLLKLQLSRIDDGAVPKRIYDRVANIWWANVRRWVLAAGGMMLSIAGLGAAAKADYLPDIIPYAWQGAADDHLVPAALAIQIGLAAFLTVSYFMSRQKTREEPAKFSLSDYLKVPDYDKALGSVHEIHEDLEKVLRALPKQGTKPSPLVVFIDDLDRCAPASVAGVVEGVSSFLASGMKCVFIIGMDPQMVAAALEDAHENVRDKLPSFERSVPLGWRFMDKFVQLPFTIPPSNAADFEDFMQNLIQPPASAPDEGGASGGGEPAALDIAPLSWLADLGQALLDQSARLLARAAGFLGMWTRPAKPAASGTSAGSRPTGGPAPETPQFEESRDVGIILEAVKDQTAGNPRELKRLANLARFYLQLRNERRRSQPAWEPPAPECYARWIVLTARWPDMMRWLLWGADEAFWRPTALKKPLATRRLEILEDHADGTVEAWRKQVANALNIPDTPKDALWLSDPKLFEFFSSEGKLDPARRLSAAASREFW